MSGVFEVRKAIVLVDILGVSLEPDRVLRAVTEDDIQRRYDEYAEAKPPHTIALHVHGR